MSTFDELASTYQADNHQQQRQEAAERYTQQLAQEREQRQQQRTYRSKTREVHRQWRDQQREARYYAEAWWQAIRAWQTKEVRELVPRTKVGSGSEGRMRPIVGNYGRGQAYLTYTEVRTPMGLVSESALARAISESGCAALERAREGTGLGSLIHNNGRGWNGGQAKAYAAALLALAIDLGDLVAADHLNLLNVGN